MAIIPEAAAEREKLEKDLANFQAIEKAQVDALIAHYGVDDTQLGIVTGVVYSVLADDTLRAHIARVRDCKKLLDSYGPAPE